MVIVKCGLVILWLGIVPLILGMLYTKYAKKDRESMALSYCSGLLMMLALLQVITVPLTFLKKGLTSVLILWIGVIVCCCVVSLVLNRHDLNVRMQHWIKRIKSYPWTMWVAILLIAVQTMVLTTQCHIDDDDSFYVGTATAAVETGGLYAVDPYTGAVYEELPSRYVLSPFPIFTASCAKITGIHPAVMAHTIFPFFFIPFAYLIYGLIGKRLFREEDWKTGYFLILVSMIHIFSAYSTHTTGIILLIRIWQGKALLGSALIPAVYDYAFRAFESEKNLADYGMLIILMLACCHVSSMGIMLGAIALGIAGISWTIRNRRWKVLIPGALCCMPNLIYAAIYLMIK